jgi:hypothetical protein
MISFDKPLNFEGVQFCEELEAAGVSINKDTSPMIDGNGDFWLDIDAKDAQKAQDVLSAHIPKPRPESTIVEKLATVGLNLDDLKSALGL